MNQDEHKLLICIAYHFNPDRSKYLDRVVGNILDNYKCDVNIIIDTNIDGVCIFDHRVKFITHTNLEHPFHLTSMHKRHFKENIDKYDVFMYVEDDELIPYENYLHYLENFELLYPKFVPGLVRIEMKDGEKYISDVTEPHSVYNNDILIVGDKIFTTFKFPQDYFGAWIMPQAELKENIKHDFTKLLEGREFAAMFSGWGIGKKPLVEIELKGGKYFIKESCYSYHLPNNYALHEGLPQGKIKINEVLI